VGIIKNQGMDVKIRARAEELLRDKINDLNIPPDVSELIHELQVHQIELEIQNEELKRYQSQLQTSKNRYFELYNLAPIGYFTLDENELIKDVNIAGANLLGLDKNKLVNRAFIRFIAFKSRNKFFELVKNFMEKKESQRCELNLLKNKKPFPVIMEISARPTDEGGLESFLITVVDITELKEAESELQKSLEEKEMLLKEIHHRVKNNLQVISSLLHLQRQYVGDEEADEVLMESQNRVKSMAMLHEKLYQSEDLSNIRISDYVESLVNELFYSYAVKIGRINPVLDIDDVTLNMETAVPGGLLISELVSNSLKHAFPGRREGEIRVSLKKFHDKYELTVSDNGIGLPNDVNFQKTDSLGLQLINTLVGQIEGDIELDKNQGTEFKIVFKELKYNKRL
jgi:PAS domain S-box-containing protein